MSEAHHICIVAAERSGDQLGASLKRALEFKSKTPLVFSGIGGSALAAEGITSPVDIAPLSILGLVEGLMAYPVVMERVRESTEHIMAEDPDMVILIDSWGFMLRVAKALRKAGSRATLVKYVAPQVWAMRAGRAKTLAGTVDHLLSIQSFDKPYFDEAGLPNTFVGNPMFDEDFTSGDAGALRTDLQLAPRQRIISVLFGSRLSEVQRLSPHFADAVRRLRDKYADLVFVSPVADNVAADVRAAAMTHDGLQDVIFLEEHRKLDCFAASDAAIACSGTVTTQLAAGQVPSVVAYILGGLSHFLIKRLYRPDYVSLVNIAANEEVLPEFIQSDCTGENLANAVSVFLDDEAHRKQNLAKIEKAVAHMKGKGGRASERAASKVLELLTD